MKLMPHRGDDDLRLVVVVRVDLSNLANQIHAEMAYGIEPADEGTDISRSRLGGQQRLQRRKCRRQALVLIPSAAVAALTATSPSLITGTFTTTLGLIFASFLPL